jgi:hypothetical protein
MELLLLIGPNSMVDCIRDALRRCKTGRRIIAPVLLAVACHAVTIVTRTGRDRERGAGLGRA